MVNLYDSTYETLQNALAFYQFKYKFSVRLSLNNDEVSQIFVALHEVLQFFQLWQVDAATNKVLSIVVSNQF